MRSLILFSLLALTCIGCAEKEYQVRDLTTYGLQWFPPEWNIDSNTINDYYLGDTLTIRRQIPSIWGVSSIQSIQKDTNLFRLYVKSGWATIKGVPSVFYYDLAFDDHIQTVNFCSTSTNSIEDMECIPKICQENEVLTFWNKLEDWQIWKQHSFPTRTVRTFDTPLFYIEIREGEKYKFMIPNGPPYILAAEIGQLTHVGDDIKDKLISEFNEYTNDKIDDLPAYNMDISRERFMHYLNEGYFDHDSLWLVE